MADRPASFAIKAEVPDLRAARYAFAARKTMYGGRRIAVGDCIFLFASENEGGVGLFARGIVVESEPVAAVPDVKRQTPRVSIVVEVTGAANAPLTLSSATNKIAGLSTEAGAFLEGFFAAE